MAKKKYTKSTTPTVLIDAAKINKDVHDFCVRNGIKIQEFYDSIGIGTATIYNTVRNAEQNTIGVDFSEYEFCEKFGLISDMCLKLICLRMGKDESEYIAKKKPKELKAVTAAELLAEDTTAEDIRNDMLQGFASVVRYICELGTLIEKLGKIQAQNMEYLLQIKDGIEKLNDKWK